MSWECAGIPWKTELETRPFAYGSCTSKRKFLEKSGFPQSQHHLEHPPSSPRPQFHTENFDLWKNPWKSGIKLKFGMNFGEEFSPRNITGQIPPLGYSRSNIPFPKFSLFLSSFFWTPKLRNFYQNSPQVSSRYFSRDRTG